MLRRTISSYAAILSFSRAMFLLSTLKVSSSRQVDRHQFQIKVGIKLKIAKDVRRLSGPIAAEFGASHCSFLSSDVRKLARERKLIFESRQ